MHYNKDGKKPMLTEKVNIRTKWFCCDYKHVHHHDYLLGPCRFLWADGWFRGPTCRRGNFPWPLQVWGRFLPTPVSHIRVHLVCPWMCVASSKGRPPLAPAAFFDGIYVGFGLPGSRRSMCKYFGLGWFSSICVVRICLERASWKCIVVQLANTQI